MNSTWIGAGRFTLLPAWAEINAAKRYCPSTPMLNRFILKPMATAVAEKISGVARSSISTSLSVLPAVSTIVVKASTGFFPVTARMKAEIPRAINTPRSDAATVTMAVWSWGDWLGVRILSSGFLEMSGSVVVTTPPSVARRSCSRRVPQR